MTSCMYCGKFVKVCKVFCSDVCEKDWNNLSKKAGGTFRSYAEAARHLEKDVRVIKKWEGKFFTIDKSLPNPRIKWLTCKECGCQVTTKEGRLGYCNQCSSKGLGRQAQANIISQMYVDKNNPNYVDGKAAARNRWRSTRSYKNWSKDVLEECRKCMLSGMTNNLETHHILPVALFPEFKTERWNGIVLASHYHIELHRLRLDVELLPTLYESRSGVQDLRTTLLHQPQVQSLLQLPVKQYHEHELVRVVPRNYHKLVQHRHPEFFQSVLAR